MAPVCLGAPPVEVEVEAEEAEEAEAAKADVPDCGLDCVPPLLVIDELELEDVLLVEVCIED